MVTTLRAALAVVLLAGFVVFGGAVIVGLVVAGVLLYHYSNRLGAKLIFVALAAAVAIAAALWKVLRAKPQPPEGLRLTSGEAPELWHIVTELADQVGTRPPDQILLIGEVNAAVTENTRWLGLVGGRRYLLIGLPLLLTLRVDELRAILAHELGHYSHSHTRLGALTYRGRVTIVETLRRLGDGLVGTLMQGYATMYLLVESAVSRRQEIEADAAAARYGGREAAVSALSRLATIDHAWQSYLDQHVAWGLDSGNAPTGITAGFATLLHTTDTHLAADGAPERKHSRWDSHPPTAARIAAIRALPDSPVAPDPRYAAQLVPDFAAVAAAADAAVFDFGKRARIPMPEYTARAAQFFVQQRADRLYRGAGRLAGDPHPGLGTVLHLVADGRHGELVRATLGADANGPAGQVAAAYTRLVEAAILAAAVNSGVASWRHSWTEPVRAVDTTGAPFGVGRLAAAVTSGAPESAAQTASALAALGIDIGQARVVAATSDGTGAQTLTAVTNVKLNGRRRDVIVLDIGLVFVPPCPWLMQKWASSERRLFELARSTSPEDLIARNGHVFIPDEDMASARWARKYPLTYEVTRHDGTTFRVRYTIYTKDLTGNDAMIKKLGTLAARSTAKAKRATAAV
jgi:Zn-dependent protease with chaperone function